MFLFTVIVILITIFDQLIKFLIESNLYSESIEVIEGIFSLTYLKNFGAAWGIFSENSWLLLLLTPILIFTIIYYLIKFSERRYEMIFGGLVVGGAFGNYIDRIFRGYVVDYLDFKVWPVFNFADVCIVLGCILFCISFWRYKEK